MNFEIFQGAPNKPYRSLGAVKAQVGALTVFNAAPTEQAVNMKLQMVASRLGANGVINVRYKRGVTLTSWKGLTAYGEAVFFES
jgi:uncharacterized protein YbjQ (UPF0145 family)